MSRAARTIFIWSFYLLAVGATVAVAPNVFLAVFGLPSTQEPWIRVSGMFLLFLAYFCYRSAQSENTEFFHWMVHVRVAVIFFLAALVLFVGAPPIILLVGIVDLAAAIWTWTALRADAAVGGIRAGVH